MKKNHSHFWLKLFEAALLIIAFFTAVFLIAAGTEQYWKKPDIEVKMSRSAQISPSDSVMLAFNQSVDTSRIGKTISIQPEAKVNLEWKHENSQLEIKPISYLQPGQSYTLYVSIPRGLLQRKMEMRTFQFNVQNLPKVVAVIPGNVEEDIKIDSNFQVSFDEPTNDFNIGFEINPEGAFSFETDEAKQEFRIIPKEKLQYDTAYSMRVTAQPVSNNGEAEQREIFAGKFQTEKKPAPMAVRSNSAVIPEDQVVDLFARVENGKYIDINLAKQHLSIFEDTKRLGTFRISSGKSGMATPTGNFKIMGKRGRAWSNKYKLYMPYFMQFTGVGHGIHELPEWPGGYKEGAAHLGIPVSHGCVRLGIGPAETVYNFSSVGTPVVIHY